MKTKSILSYAAIDIKPQDIDWTLGYTETWDFFVGCRCEKCGEIIMGRGGEQHCDLNNGESECDGWVESSEGPMMNYFYSLPDFEGDVEQTCRKLSHLPLCLVQFTDTDQWALALTGGGMDLSWEICEAFAICGYLPPTHFCDLPKMAGRGESSRDRRIISTCRQSLRGMKSRATWALRSLNGKFKRAAYLTPQP